MRLDKLTTKSDFVVSLSRRMAFPHECLKVKHRFPGCQESPSFIGNKMEGKPLEMLPLFLWQLEKLESLETGFLDHDGNRFFVRPEEEDSMVFNNTEGIFVGLDRSAAHFFHAQGSHRPVVLLGHLQNQDTRRKKLFNSIGEVVICPSRKM